MYLENPPETYSQTFLVVPTMMHIEICTIQLTQISLEYLIRVLKVLLQRFIVISQKTFFRDYWIRSQINNVRNSSKSNL